MREFDVYFAWSSVTVKAEKVETIILNNKPIKTLFITDGKIVAEFFCEHVAGWVERKER